MKRILKILLCVICLLSLLVLNCGAIESNIDQYKEEFDYGNIIDALDDETLEILEDIGLTEISYESIFSVQPGKIFEALFNIAAKSAKTPLKFLFLSTGVLILTTFLTSFMKSGETVSLVGSAVLSLSIAVPFANLLTTSFSVLEALGFFVTAFSGVFCGVVSSAGYITTSISHASLAVFSNNLFSQVLSEISQPMINSICTLGFLSCFDMFNFTRQFSETVKKIYVFILSFIGTVFSGIVTLKGVLAEGADNLTSRSIRFVVGRSLPVVGGTVSETYSTLISSLHLIKNTVGAFGIITVIVIVLPTVLSLIMWLLSLEITISVSETFSETGINGMLNVFKDVLVLLLATIAIVTTILVVSVGVVIAVKGR